MGQRGSRGELCWHPCEELLCARRAYAEMTKLSNAAALFRVVKIKTDRAEVQQDLIILSDWQLNQQVLFTVAKGEETNTG